MASPRVLVVMRKHWTRALLLAALQERGYDAVGAATLEAALAFPVQELGRGPVGLILLDHDVPRDDPRLVELLERHPAARRIFLQSALHRSFSHTEHSLRYPVSIGEIVRLVEQLLPLSRG